MTLMQTITFAPSLSLSQSLFLDFRLMLYRPLFQMCTPSLQSMGLVLHILLKLILYCVGIQITTHKKQHKFLAFLFTGRFLYLESLNKCNR